MGCGLLHRTCLLLTQSGHSGREVLASAHCNWRGLEALGGAT
jgi:hypothetical protein